MLGISEVPRSDNAPISTAGRLTAEAGIASCRKNTSPEAEYLGKAVHRSPFELLEGSCSAAVTTGPLRELRSGR
jgi:hypothetical protein